MYATAKSTPKTQTFSGTPEIGAAKTPVKNGSEPVKLLKRIGSTTIEVTVHFSNTSKETLEDKLLRMIEREVSDG
jgi:hypothetical protein